MKKFQFLALLAATSALMIAPVLADPTAPATTEAAGTAKPEDGKKHHGGKGKHHENKGEHEGKGKGHHGGKTCKEAPSADSTTPAEKK